MLLILGNHRSGTNLAHEIFSMHPSAEVINEPFSLHNGFFRGVDMDGKDYLRQENLPVDVATFLEKLERYWNSGDGRVVGMKETIMIDKIESLKALLRPIWCLWVLRDPVATTASIISSPNLSHWEYFNSYHNAKSANLFNSFGVDCLEGQSSQFHMISALVHLKIKMLESAAGFERKCLFRLEDFVHDPIREMSRLLEWAGLSLTESHLGYSGESSQARGGAHSVYRNPSAVKDRWKSILTASQAEFAQSYFRAVRECYGYA